MLSHDLKPSVWSAVLLFCCTMGLLFSSGCAIFMSSATSDMMNRLSKTILDTDDLSLVETGAPSYLLMIDSLIDTDPDDETLLSAAANLYTAYADVFVQDMDRSGKMTDKALGYANRAICLSDRTACDLKSRTFEEFKTIVSSMEKQQVPTLFSLGNAWAGWIMAHKNDLDAIADIAHIEHIMRRVIELDRTYKGGAAYVYLGTLSSLLPPALGGQPEKARHYFETAITLSRGKNLMAKVLFAKLYARLMFDRRLHDDLLEAVMAADPHAPGYTLSNTWAQKQAEHLMDSADDYF